MGDVEVYSIACLCGELGFRACLALNMHDALHDDRRHGTVELVVTAVGSSDSEA